MKKEINKYLKIDLSVSFNFQTNTFIDLLTNKILINVKNVKEKDWCKVYEKDCGHFKEETRKPTQEEIDYGYYYEDDVVTCSYLNYGGLFEYKNGFDNYVCPICNSEFFKELDINPIEISKEEFTDMGECERRTYYGEVDDYNPDPYYDDFTEKSICCKELEDRETDEYKIVRHQFYGESEITEIRIKKDMFIDEIYYFENSIVLKISAPKKKFKDLNLEDKFKYISNLLKENREYFIVLERDNWSDVETPICITEEEGNRYINIISNNNISKNTNKIADVKMVIEGGFIWGFEFILNNNETIKCNLHKLGRSTDSIPYKYY